MRSLTLQTGKHANWVGAHYWSALEHKPEWSTEETRALYNETVHGVLNPRLFVIDSADSIGPISIELPAEDTSSTEFPVQRIEPEQHPVHPLRQSVLLGQSSDVAFPTSSFHSWTDFWEPVALPDHKLVVPLSEAPSETSHRFWFEYPELTPELIDETALRRLIEETDESVDLIRSISTISNGLVANALGITDYLSTAYPKSAFLTLTSAVPHLQHFQHDHALPGVVNLANLIFTESIRDRTTIVVPPHRDLDLLTTSAQEALWLDSLVFKPTQSTVVEAPYLSVDGAHVFPGTDSGYGSSAPCRRQQPAYKNRASPIAISNSSDIIAGTFASSSLGPVLEATIPLLRRFERDFKAAWEPFDVEKDDLDAIVDHLESLVSETRPPSEE